jgi:Icc-related predicted phosphoesterase
VEKSYYKALSISYTHLALSHSFQAKAFAVLGNSDQEQFYQRLSVDAERLSDRYIQKLQEVE